jgi:hypothetical protein
LGRGKEDQLDWVHHLVLVIRRREIKLHVEALHCLAVGFGGGGWEALDGVEGYGLVWDFDAGGGGCGEEGEVSRDVRFAMMPAVVERGLTSC